MDHRRIGATDMVAEPRPAIAQLARQHALQDVARASDRRNVAKLDRLRHTGLVGRAIRPRGHRRRAGRDLELTPREADLLELLLRNPRGVVTRELALDEVWGGEGTLNAVDRYVAYLRRKLGDPPLIHTVRGVGFRLDRE